MEGMSLSGGELFCLDQTLVTSVKQKETGQPSAVGSGGKKRPVVSLGRERCRSGNSLGQFVWLMNHYSE